jgi:hypothetical protein
VGSLLVLLAAGAVARAGPVFGDASAEMLLDLDGNWPRAFPDHERNGFVMFSAGGGDYKLTHGRSDLTTDHFDDRLLTGRKDLKDHDIRPCPDGTWLHVATGDVAGDHDSAWSWRYKADFSIQGNATVAEASTDGSNFVDVPAVCGPEFQGFAYAFPPTGLPARFVVLGEAAAVDELVDLHYGPFATGASLVNDRDATLWILGGYTDAGKDGTKFITAQYDTNWEVGTRRVLEVAPEGHEVYWPQTTIRVGNYYIVAHMMRDLASNWTQQEGNLVLSAFEVGTWAMVDQLQLSSNTAPNGGMQPFVVFDEEDRLVALYSKQLRNYGFTVELQPEVLEGLEDTAVQDTGGEDTGNAAEDSGADTAALDSGAHDGDTGILGEDCGCGSGGSGVAPAGTVAAFALLRRANRRRNATSGSLC